VIVLAADSNTIDGCDGLRAVTDSVAELRQLYVRSSHQRREIERLLATTVVNRARAIRYRAMRFKSSACMHAALTICEGLGFRQVPRFSEDPMPDKVFYDHYFPATRYTLGCTLRACSLPESRGSDGSPSRLFDRFHLRKSLRSCGSQSAGSTDDSNLSLN